MVLVYKQMFSFFVECIIIFQAPAQFPKNKDVSNTTLHELEEFLIKFGCSSCALSMLRATNPA